MTTAPPEKIDQRLAAVQPGTLRHQILEALRRFRASWIDLGRFLNELAYGGDYREWGYDDLEIYCARELGLKKPTVQKLMISYNYMKKYEAERLHAVEGGDDESKEQIPAFTTVELLDRARRCEGLPEERMEELHQLAFSGPENDAEKDLRQELRATLKPTVHSPAEQGQRQARADILRHARILRKILPSWEAVPDGLRERLEQALTELEALD